MKNNEIRCIARNCPYSNTCFLHNTKSNIVYDYSYSCDKDSGFKYYIPTNKESENK